MKWSEPAGAALVEIYEYIAKDSPAAARNLVERIVATAAQTEAFPESGRVVPEYEELDYREIIVGNYRVQYQLGGDPILIVTVIHGRRLLRPERD